MLTAAISDASWVPRFTIRMEAAGTGSAGNMSARAGEQMATQVALEALASRSETGRSGGSRDSWARTDLRDRVT